MAKLHTATKIKRIVAVTQKGQVRILFGLDPGKGCPFEAAANYLKKRLTAVYKGSKVTVNATSSMASAGALMEFLLKTRSNEQDKIRELHVFSHAWPSGLSLNFGGKPSSADKAALERVYGKAALSNIGANDYDEFNPIQFRISNLQFLNDAQIKGLRASFAPNAIVRFWGCNSGWNPPGGDTDPYTNMAEAIANYAGVTAYGSPKSTEFYAYKGGKWTNKVTGVGKTTSFPFELRAYKSQGKQQSNKFTPVVAVANLIKKTLDPRIKYADGSFNTISAVSGKPELFTLPTNATVYFTLFRFENCDKKITLFTTAGGQVEFDKLMKVQSHPEWSLSADKKEVTVKKGRDGFQAKTLRIIDLLPGGLDKREYYFRVVSVTSTGSTTFEGKKCRFTF